MTDHYKSRASTHADGCWDWGPKHYECAVGKIKRLQAEVEKLRAKVEKLRVDRERGREYVPLYAAPVAAQAPRPCTCHPDDRPDGSCRKKYASDECRAAAIDAAMQQGGAE